MTRVAARSLLRELLARLGAGNVLWAPSELAVYDCDAFTPQRQRPDMVVFPRGTRQVADVVGLCREHGVPIVPRGAGTSLAGGCLPLGGGVVVMLTRMNRILEINLRERLAVVEAGVVNLQLTRALAGTGYHFAPDPSSQGASTIGGNVATNAGGPHTLKYGVTVNHVLGLEAVLGDGATVQLGPVEDPAGLDLVGLLVGSEGTLGIVTKIWVRLTPDPQDYRALRAIFPTVDDASNAVSRIIAAGIIPAAMELMDQGILAAVEEAYRFGFPPDAGAILVIEVDGPAAGLDQKQRQIVEFCRAFQAREILQAASPAEREALWKCRKMAVGATGRLSPNYIIEDGVVPRTRLPHVLRRIAEIGKKHQLRVVNVAHAGDGNVHPILLFDERDRGQVERALAAGREMLEECIACGGSITAEHGIGVEKLALMPQLFAPADLEAMNRVRQAFDPRGLLNPGKLLPPQEQAEIQQRLADPRQKPPAPLHEHAAPRTNAKTISSEGRLPLVETIAPADEAAVAAAVRSAAQEGTAVYPLGGGTGLDYGARPSRPGIGLSLANLRRVIDYPADDMTITVEAGLPVAELARCLAEKRQRLPVDVAEADRATLGGLLASNFSGPRRYGCGTIRDYVLGIRAVDGRGTAFSGGGRVVKNAAGYNICRLMIGSLGTLGVITQATLMVRPMPETSALVACDLPEFDAAERLLAALVRSQTLPAAVELAAGPARQDCPVFGPLPTGHLARLIVGFEGTATEVEWMVGQLHSEWRQLGVDSPLCASAAAAEPAWRWLTEFSADLQISVSPGVTVAMTRRLLDLDPDGSVQARAGNGIIGFRLSPTSSPLPLGEGKDEGGSERSSPLPLGEDEGEGAPPGQLDPFTALLRAQIRPAVAACGGRLVVLKCPAGAPLTGRDVWGPPGDGAVVMQAIKDRFDPQGILNPGRFSYDNS